MFKFVAFVFQGEAKSHELATDFDPFPTLSFMEFVARDFPPSDIDPADCTSLSVPPLVWSEFNKTPAEVCVTNTGHHRNSNFLPFNHVNTIAKSILTTGSYAILCVCACACVYEKHRVHF